jgi:hypothetical protein
LLDHERLHRLVRQGRLWLDLQRIKPLAPPFAASYEQWRELKRALEPAYERYVAEISDRHWTASLELSAVAWHFCRVMCATSILELGSGFTSYVFRRHAAEAEYPVRVISLDHDAYWLTKTERFLIEQGTTSEGLDEIGELDRLSPTSPSTSSSTTSMALSETPRGTAPSRCWHEAEPSSWKTPTGIDTAAP